MLHLLPTETALHIASYLPLQSLHRVLLVSKEWHSLIVLNDQTVYRNAAILHRFVLQADLEAGTSSHMPDRQQIDWTQFCSCSALVQLVAPLTISTRSTTIGDREGLAWQGAFHRERADQHR
jgi:hypothetical protein